MDFQISTLFYGKYRALSHYCGLKHAIWLPNFFLRHLVFFFFFLEWGSFCAVKNGKNINIGEIHYLSSFFIKHLKKENK